jgi:hypothetical protein
MDLKLPIHIRRRAGIFVTLFYSRLDNFFMQKFLEQEIERCFITSGLIVWIYNDNCGKLLELRAGKVLNIVRGSFA